MHYGVQLMTRADAVKFSIIIATYNRAAVLQTTLESLACLQPQGSWEIIVVDNNSPDDTRQVVEAATRTFVPLRYVAERERTQRGAEHGLGRARRDPRDDRRRCQDRAGSPDRIAAGLEAHGCDYIGGASRLAG
jgi:hypothetical protein